MAIADYQTRMLPVLTIAAGWTEIPLRLRLKAAARKAAWCQKAYSNAVVFARK